MSDEGLTAMEPHLVAASRLSLRVETEADIPFLQQVYASTRWFELEVTPWTDAQKLEFLHSQFALQRMHYYQHYDGASFDIIELGGQPVGRLYVHRDLEIRIMDIALLPEYKYRGIGKHYFAQFLAESRANGKPITLHVEHNNPARVWYGKLGFVELEEVGVYIKMRWDS
jgi:ribosomal protein S18 acetylase RimI-like enzyme